MYNFIFSMYKQGKIDEEKVMSYVPKYITKEQAKSILDAPQI